MNSPSGREVVLTSSSFTIPVDCASCLAPSAASITTKKRKGIPGRGSETLSIQVPYCHACAQRAKSAQWKEIAVTAGVLGIAALASALSYVVPSLPMPAVVALGAGPALLVAILAMTVLKPKHPGAPATAAGEAVRITAFEGRGKFTLYCTNADWADRFAQLNGHYAHAKPKSRGERFGWMTLPLAIIAGPAIGYSAFLTTHPLVYVDNPSADSLSIFVDGKKRVDVGANQLQALRVGRGTHLFGYAKSGAGAPTATVSAEVKVGKAHLYNPGRSGCYWLDATSYGTATVAGVQQGPQPITEFYRFEKVNNWFTGNPGWVKVEKGETGKTQVALNRSPSCMSIAGKPCGVEAREKLVACQLAANNEESFDACLTQAEKACGMGVVVAAPAPSASSKLSAPAPKPQGKQAKKK